MFTKDTRTEVFLTQMGVDFRYTNNVAFSELVPGWDCKNLARPTPQRDDAILEYAALMDGGSPAPAPILNKNGSYGVLDGIQRLCAAQLSGATRISAYVVSSDSEDLLDSIRVLANIRLQGRQEPAEWTRRRAVEILVIQRGMSPAEVARLGGWAAADIKRLAELMEWGFTIRSIGGPDLPDSVVDVVAGRVPQENLRKYAKPVAGFLNVLKDCKFSARDAAPLADEFFAPTAKPSYKLYQTRLDDIRTMTEVEIRLKGRKGSKLPPDVNLRRALRSVETIIDELDAPLVYVDEFFRMVKSIEKKLKALSKHSPAPVAVKSPADKWKKHA